LRFATDVVPAVTIGGDIYIDPVFVTDANIEEAIRRGADELWIIWTVSERGEWNDGFIANYFQIIETAANGNFKRMLKRIDENNLAIAEGSRGSSAATSRRSYSRRKYLFTTLSIFVRTASTKR
jgi:hypothetical protein